jgi:hypothetical protein
MAVTVCQDRVSVDEGFSFSPLGDVYPSVASGRRERG